MKLKMIPKLVCIYGSLLDGFMGIIMILTTMAPTIIIPYSSNAMNYQYIMGVAASLMFGWTVLLYWASLDPIARRDVMLLTIFPVVLGLILTEILIDPLKLFSIWLYQIIGCIIPLIIGYVIALKIERSKVVV